MEVEAKIQRYKVQKIQDTKIQEISCADKRKQEFYPTCLEPQGVGGLVVGLICRSWLKSADPRSGVLEHLGFGGRFTSPPPPSALGVSADPAEGVV